MPINIGKNLKIQPTNDVKVSKFVRSYDKIYDYIEENYQDETQNISLYDLLTSMLETYVISYANVPTGATFNWKIGSQTLTNPATVYSGQVVEYELIYSDGSECVDSFVVSEDYTLDSSLLEPNKFIVSITSDKTITTLFVTRHKGTPEQVQTRYTSLPDNTFTCLADKNEFIEFNPYANGWCYKDRTPYDYGMTYNVQNITSNQTVTALFPYESWESYTIYLNDEFGSRITNISSYWDNITFTGDTSNIDYKREMYSSCFCFWGKKNSYMNYTINIDNYSPITGDNTFTYSKQITKTLVPYCTYTLTPIPADATVTLAASGYNTVSGVGPQSITVEKGTNVVWMIEKDEYETGSGTTTVTTNPQSETQEIEKRNFKVNIDDYEYTFEDGILKLTKYIGSGTTPTTPGLENI